MMHNSDQSSTPLLDEGDIENKLTKAADTKIVIVAEETSFNTQAFWLLVWMTKYVARVACAMQKL